MNRLRTLTDEHRRESDILLPASLFLYGQALCLLAGPMRSGCSLPSPIPHQPNAYATK
jgi:hypothetical protein